MALGKAIGNLGRAPVPEWEELARAATHAPTPQFLTRLAASAQVPLLALSVAGGLVAAGLGLGWVGLALWLLGGVADWAATPADPPAARLLDLVGLRAPLRGLLRSLPALALVFVVSGAGPGLALATVVLTGQLAWSVQPVLATWLWRSAPPLRYLPAGGAQPAPLTAHSRVYARGYGTPGLLLAAEFLALAAALLLPTIALWLAGVAVAVAVAYLTWTLLQARAVRRRQAQWTEELLSELDRLAPTFLVYVSLAARQARYIVNQWLPALDALAQDGLLLVREASQLATLAPTRHPVVYGPSPRDVERLTLASVRVAFYLAYGERNGQLLRDPRLRHVMLLHGDSDKATSANGMARAFDEIWVAGPAAIERYRAAGVALANDRFVVIGRPQVAALPSGPTGQERPVLLYAPTFEGYYQQTSHSSLDSMGVELVTRLLLDYPQLQVWFRPHPASGVTRPSMLVAINRINELLRHTPGGHLVTGDRDLTLPECLAAADVLVSDISSVATDFLATGRPVITCDPAGLPAAEFIATYPTQAASYLLHPGLTDLDRVLADALGPDPLRAARQAMKKQVLGDPPGGPQATFANNVARLTAP